MSDGKQKEIHIQREKEGMRRVEADKDYADTEKQRRGTGGGGT